MAGALFVAASEPQRASAQAIQAARGLAVDNNRREVAIGLEHIGAAVAQARLISQLRSSTCAPLAAAAQPFASTTNAALAEQASAAAATARGDPETFFRRYAVFFATARTAGVEVESTSVKAGGDRMLGNEPNCKVAIDQVSSLLSTPVPALGVLARDVTFTLGLDFASAARGGALGVSLNTNMLGAVASQALTPLGASDFADYVKNNVAAGIAVPASGRTGQLGSQLGLGLGRLEFGKRTLWPVLGIDQVAAVDRQVPDGVRSARPGETSWSSPVIAVASTILPHTQDEVAQKLKARRAVPVVSVGVRLPYFFPGDAFSAFGALFTSRRADFARAGRGQVTIGVAVPLFRLQPSDPRSVAPAVPSQSDPRTSDRAKSPAGTSPP